MLSIRVSILDVGVGAIVWAYGVEYGSTGPRVYLVEKTRTRFEFVTSCTLKGSGGPAGDYSGIAGIGWKGR